MIVFDATSNFGVISHSDITQYFYDLSHGYVYIKNLYNHTLCNS